MTSSLSVVETDSQSDVVDQVFGSTSSSLMTNRHRRSDFIPELCDETLPPSKQNMAERDDYVSWEKIDF